MIIASGCGDKARRIPVKTTASLPGLTGQSSNHCPRFACDYRGYWIPAFAGMTREVGQAQAGLAEGLGLGDEAARDAACFFSANFTAKIDSS